MRYLVQSRYQIKCYGFLSFAKNMFKNIGKSIMKSLRGIYSQKHPDQAKKLPPDGFKTA